MMEQIEHNVVPGTNHLRKRSRSVPHQIPVSYTHLDVYKRQVVNHNFLVTVFVHAISKGCRRRLVDNSLNFQSRNFT